MSSQFKVFDRGKPALLAAAVTAVCITTSNLPASAQDVPSGAILVTPDMMAWKPHPRHPGQEASDLIGDSTKVGPYVLRAKFPANTRIPPHAHPEERAYTIISGIWFIGWGKSCDAAKMIALPPGSYYTEPADTPHCVETRGEPVVLQVSGIGPSGMKRLDMTAR